MKKIHLMTAVTMVVADPVSSLVRAAQAFGPDGANLRERLRAGAGKLLRRVGRMINDRVAGAIAYRERRLTRFALRNLSDIELNEFGACRGNPGSVHHRYRDVRFTTRR